MRILYCHEAYYTEKRDGIYSYSAYPYQYWQDRFLNKFDNITVIGRKKKSQAGETGVLEKSSGECVNHVLLPNIHAPIKRLTKQGRIHKIIREQVAKVDAVVVRGPIDFGIMAATVAQEMGKPYMVEMLGCSYDQAFGGNDMFNKVYAPLKFKYVQHMVKNASGVIYSSKEALQDRYPTTGLSVFTPSIEILPVPKDMLQKRTARIEQNNDVLNIGMIGSFDSGMRGVSTALKALGQVKLYAEKHADFPDFKFKILGQAQANTSFWSSLIHENNLQDHVEFGGRVPTKNSDVLSWLDGIDVYLKPSFHEALPRYVVEAMSRGCSVLSSDTGEMRALLSGDFIHECGHVDVFSRQIIAAMGKEMRQFAAKENIKTAKLFAQDYVDVRRDAFWDSFESMVRDSMEATPSAQVAV